MNDASRIFVGLTGTAASGLLANSEIIAAIAAGTATTVYMIISAIEKIKAMKANRPQPKLKR